MAIFSFSRPACGRRGTVAQVRLPDEGLGSCRRGRQGDPAPVGAGLALATGIAGQTSQGYRSIRARVWLDWRARSGPSGHAETHGPGLSLRPIGRRWSLATRVDPRAWPNASGILAMHVLG